MSLFTKFFKESDTQMGVFYPNHYLLAVFRNLETAQQTVKKLRSAGFAEDDVIAAAGQDFIALAKEETGLGSFLMQTLSRFFATEQMSHDRDLDLAQLGAAFVAVHCPHEETKKEAWNVIQPESPLAARYYAYGGIEHLAAISIPIKRFDVSPAESMSTGEEPIKVLTIEREYGSGAAEIAQKLADRLGWKLWDQLLTDEIARRLECDSGHIEKHGERKDPLYYRLLKSFLRGSFEGNLSNPQMQMADAEGIRRVAEQVVTAVASEGSAVIVGRGSAYYLRDRPDCFHIFVYAPFEERVRRLQRAGKSEKEAIQFADTVDRDRADFINRYFGIEWPARHFFHLMINSTMGDTAVVQTVLHGLSAIRSSAGHLNTAVDDGLRA